MTTYREQLKLHYEQQKALIEQIKEMRAELTNEQKLTHRFRKQRDRYKEERQTLLSKVSPDIESRDSQKNLVEDLKKRRDFLRRQSRRSEGPIFKILTNNEMKQLSLVELKFHLYELEFAQQTTSSLSQTDEEILIDEIRKIEDRISLLEKRNEAMVADYLGNVPETKEKIEKEIYNIEKQISKEEADRKEVSDKIQEIYIRIRPLKEEEDKTHGEFVKHLQNIENIKVEIDAKQEELDSLKGKIAKIKKLIAEEDHKKVYGEIEKKIELLLKKKEQGENLTPEEQEFLMGYGYVPF